MSKIVRLLEYRRGTPLVHFTRSEMNSLLSLYSRRVMRGEWRDYAIDQSDGMARFAVFRSSLERPQYIITKQARGPQSRGTGTLAPPAHQYTVLTGRETLARGSALLDVLAVFDRPIKLRGSS
ncbi:DUF2794 domain-containing protein [Roseospira goensis]|uniref:DUF2794 domain-containing protein n=1 Tax=Roseospira goensis TaxID=391922 RepID=A0A7W6WJH3_9PROT|nr:DUF2794 domain-containing protein [Roseospira goensis]MBB4284699.1 hypothetical protein [Roseospira goensis]